MSSDTSSEVNPPFGPPDCPWRKVPSGSAIPENAVYKDGKQDGDEVYIGRVSDGKCWLVGTVFPKQGICMYLNKNSEVKSSSNYEILTVACTDPLCFQDMNFVNRNQFVAGIDENEKLLYVGCYIDSNGNTYYGWVNKDTHSLHIPRDSSLGPQVLDKDFGVMIHQFLDRLCICPRPPQWRQPGLGF